MAFESSIILVAMASYATAFPVDSTAPTMFTNSTISCGWSTSTDIVKGIQTYNLNVTNIVAQCANVCEVVFGPDALDFSGILGKGVVISLFCQAALACLFGPLLPVLLWLINLSSRPTAIRSVPLLRKLQVSVFEINAFFSISLLVSAIVRNHQNPSVMESTFIHYLLTMQLMVICGIIWAQCGDDWMGLESTSKLDWTWLPYTFVIAVAMMVTVSVTGLPDRTLYVYSQLSKECHSQHGFVSLSTFISSTAGNKPLQYFGLGVAVSVGGAILVGIFWTPVSQLLSKLVRVMPQWLRKHGVSILTTPILLFYMSMMIIDAITVDVIHNLLKEISGDLPGDNEWGYGQTTAILLWAPFAWSALKESIKHWREPIPAVKAETEMQTSKLETPRPQDEEAVPPPYRPADSPPPLVAVP